ncbi:hypothetical protein D3C72_735210 [compost metagenome]
MQVTANLTGACIQHVADFALGLGLLPQDGAAHHGVDVAVTQGHGDREAAQQLLQIRDVVQGLLAGSDHQQLSIEGAGQSLDRRLHLERLARIVVDELLDLIEHQQSQRQRLAIEHQSPARQPHQIGRRDSVSGLEAVLQSGTQFGAVLAQRRLGRQDGVSETRRQDRAPHVHFKSPAQLGPDLVEDTLVLQPESDLGFTHGLRQAGGAQQNTQDGRSRIDGAARHRSAGGEQAAVPLAPHL